jgi:uncharacterized membrane protein YbjE (DUF340 family)
MQTLIIPLFFVTGIILGISGKLPDSLITEDLSTLALSILLFLAGIGIGADRKSWNVIRSMHLKIFLVPAGIMVGTFAGVIMTSLLLPTFDLRELLAVGSGFGYYSLSSIFITKLHGEMLGLVALLSNMFREILTILLTPILVRYFGNLAAIAAGGATSMDTTLPVIIKYSGKEYAIISLFSGITLTILVPFLVTFFLTIGR